MNTGWWLVVVFIALDVGAAIGWVLCVLLTVGTRADEVIGVVHYEELPEGPRLEVMN